MTSEISKKLAPVLGVGLTTIVSGSNANGSYQITYVDGVITRVWQRTVYALTGNLTVRTLPISMPDNDYAKICAVADFGNTDFVMYAPAFTVSTITPTLRTASSNVIPSAGNHAFIVEWVKI